MLESKQVLNKEYLGHICTAMMLNELEIISWCFTLYMILHEYHMVSHSIPYTQPNLIKFISSDELVIACAIFAKFVNNSEQEQQANEIIEKLSLDQQHLKEMYLQIRDLIDDPIKMDAFYL